MIKVSDNANFVRVKLGEIKPNRFRKLDRYPLEQEVLDALKQSINDTGFWNNLQGIRNEKNEIELRFGHHRLAAGLDLFGPDYEVAVEIVEFNGVNSLQEALAYENSIHRNKVAHCNEMVSVRREWWDDVVFETYPTWEYAIEDECNFFGHGPAKNSMAVVEKYFGKQNEGGIGAYSTASKYGIGRSVLSKMLSETKSDIEQALTSLPLTARAKRGLELQAEEERVKAEAKRQEAARIAAEQAEIEREAQEEAARIKEEQDRLAAEQRKADAAAKAARDAQEKEAIAERQRLLKEKQAKAAEQQNQVNETKEAKIKVAQVAKAKVESEARQSDIRAKQKEDVIERREWYDARASEVFDRQAHGAAFRIAVSHETIREFLPTESLLPFAKAIRAELESRTGDQLTASNITNLVNENFRNFKNTLKLKEREATDQQEKDNPRLKLIRLLDVAVTDGNRFSGTLAEIESVMKTHSFTAVDGPSAGKFMDVLSKVIARSVFFNPRSYK